MTKLTTLMMMGFFQLLSLLPLRFLRFLGRVLGACWWQIGSRSKMVTLENLAICFPSMTEQERLLLAKRSLQHMVMTGLELGPIWCRPFEQLLANIDQIEGEEIIEQLLSEGKGVILLAPHIGAWEFLGLYLGKHFPTTNLYQPPDSPALHQIMLKSRQRSSAKLAPTNTRGVKILLQTLKRGELTGILPDQVPPRESGDYGDFFAIPALTTTLVKNLAARTGAKVVTGAAYRINRSGKFKLVFSMVEDAVYDDDIHTSLTALNRSVERCVMVAPEQYQWEYKRFKRQPAGRQQYYQKKR
jgi:KDO2-lipid IV(A) lauroyltransferase